VVVRNVHLSQDYFVLLYTGILYFVEKNIARGEIGSYFKTADTSDLTFSMTKSMNLYRSIKSPIAVVVAAVKNIAFGRKWDTASSCLFASILPKDSL